MTATLGSQKPKVAHSIQDKSHQTFPRSSMAKRNEIGAEKVRTHNAWFVAARITVKPT